MSSIGLQLAGSEVIPIGRFWVIPESVGLPEDVLFAPRSLLVFS
jgi:hypothetical protein